jgi:hypothetical protein
LRVVSMSEAKFGARSRPNLADKCLILFYY